MKKNEINDLLMQTGIELTTVEKIIEELVAGTRKLFFQEYYHENKEKFIIFPIPNDHIESFTEKDTNCRVLNVDVAEELMLEENCKKDEIMEYIIKVIKEKLQGVSGNGWMDRIKDFKTSTNEMKNIEELSFAAYSNFIEGEEIDFKSDIKTYK